MSVMMSFHKMRFNLFLSVLVASACDRFDELKRAEQVMPNDVALAPIDVQKKSFVAYVARDSELLVVDVTTDPPYKSVKINGDAPSWAKINAYKILADGNRVMYVANQEKFLREDLYLATLDHPDKSRRLSAVTASGRQSMGVDSFKVSPDESKVVYRADETHDEQFELILVDLDKKDFPITKISGELGSHETVMNHYQFSVDGTRVYFQVESNAGARQIAGSKDLYWSDIQKDIVSKPVRIHSSGDVRAFRLSADGSKLLYVSDHLYLVDVSGETSAKPIQLDPISSRHGRMTEDAMFTTDSSKIIYRAEQEKPLQTELYMVDVRNPLPQSPTTISGELMPGGGVVSFQITPDSSKVVFIARKEHPNVREIYVVDIRDTKPSFPVKLNGPMAVHGDVLSILISPDGKKIAYIADEEVNDAHYLYYVDVSGAPPYRSIRINNPARADEDILSHESFALDSTKIIYAAGKNNLAAQKKIFLVDVSAKEPSLARELNQDPTEEVVFHSKFSSDGEKLVYRSYRSNKTKLSWNLFLVDISNSKTPSKPLVLNDPLSPDDVIGEPTFFLQPIVKFAKN